MKRCKEFAEIVKQQIDATMQQEDIIDTVSEVLSVCFSHDGILHVFGCGHSQMFGEELCFRTGGLACVNAIMIPQYNIYPNVKLSQIMERQEGVAQGVLESMVTKPQDVMMIVSVSGRNAAGIDMALAAKNKGMKVIAVTSLDYSTKVTSRHSSGKLLKDVSDYVLDICGIKGDAVLTDDRFIGAFCSTSTVVAMTLLVGIIGDVIEKMLDSGIEPPVWVSGNLDHGDAINKEYIKKYKGRVAIL